MNMWNNGKKFKGLAKNLNSVRWYEIIYITHYVKSLYNESFYPHVVITIYVPTDGWLIIRLKKITSDFFQT